MVIKGSIRCVPSVDSSESSLGCYKYTDIRFVVADDMWLMGGNSWFNNGYSIGTPVLGMCFNLGVTGSTTAPYKIQTPGINVDIIRGHVADQITIDDDVIITGNTTITSNSIPRGFACEFSPVAVSQSTSPTLC